jgi:putative hydrolase
MVAGVRDPRVDVLGRCTGRRLTGEPRPPSEFDAHAPSGLDWQVSGCARAAVHGLSGDLVVDTWPVERLLDWTRNRPT